MYFIILIIKILCYFLVYELLGLIVCAIFDDRNSTLHKWTEKSMPNPLNFFQFLRTFIFWPIFIRAYFKGTLNEQ